MEYVTHAFVLQALLHATDEFKSCGNIAMPEAALALDSVIYLLLRIYIYVCGTLDGSHYPLRVLLQAWQFCRTT